MPQETAKSLQAGFYSLHHPEEWGYAASVALSALSLVERCCLW